MKIRCCFIAILAILIFSGCVAPAPSFYDARVVPGYTGNQSGVFATVGDAIAAAPAGLTAPHRIYIAAGNYYEKLVIDKPNIQLIGAGMERTRIYFDAYAGQENEPGKTWGTRGSGTLIIRATDIELHQLTIENSFDFLRNDALADGHPKKIRDTQAVALYLDTGSDRTLARHVKLLGFQDTLFVNTGRSWFDKSIIAGNVDFIFGAGNALFTDSEIVTRTRGKANMPHGYVTAPSTQISDTFGLTFINCRLTREPGVPNNSTHLGRPWHPTTQFSDGRYADPNAIGKAVFINSEMDAHITDAGWHSMGGTAKDGSRITFMPEDARFFEYQSRGPGAKIDERRRQLNEQEVERYTQESILTGWIEK